MFLNEYDKIIVFDTETSGLKYEQDHIIELAYAVYKVEGFNQFKCLKQKDTFIKHKNLDLDSIFIDRQNERGELMTISELTHITNEMLNTGISENDMIEEIIKNFYNPEEKTLITGYNINFDLNMIKGTMKRLGIETKQEGHFDYLDLYGIYKDNFKWSEKLDETGKQLGHRLDAAVYNLKVETKNTHRAIDDVLATMEVLKKLIEKKIKILPYINNFGFNEKYKDELVKIEGINYYPQSYKILSLYYQILNANRKLTQKR